MRTRTTRTARWASLLALLLVLATVGAAFAEFTDPGDIKQYSWDPSVGGGSPKWTNGTNPGYAEGETAVMTAEIGVKKAPLTRDLPICLQVWELPAPPTKAYGFTGFEPPFTTTRAPNLPPPSLPGGVVIDYAFPAPWDTSNPLVYGYNITINSVSAPLVGEAAGCNTNEIGVTVNYTYVTDPGYIVWGGHVAKAGDLLPAGSPDATVPVGKSANYIGGNFQARLKTTAADKTLPFTAAAAPTAVALRDLAASPLALPAGGLLAFAAVLGLAGVGIAVRRARG